MEKWVPWSLPGLLLRWFVLQVGLKTLREDPADVHFQSQGVDGRILLGIFNKAHGGSVSAGE